MAWEQKMYHLQGRLIMPPSGGISAGLDTVWTFSMIWLRHSLDRQADELIKFNDYFYPSNFPVQSENREFIKF